MPVLSRRTAAEKSSLRRPLRGIRSHARRAQPPRAPPGRGLLRKRSDYSARAISPTSSKPGNPCWRRAVPHKACRFAGTPWRIGHPRAESMAQATLSCRFAAIHLVRPAARFAAQTLGLLGLRHLAYIQQAGKPLLAQGRSPQSVPLCRDPVADWTSSGGINGPGHPLLPLCGNSPCPPCGEVCCANARITRPAPSRLHPASRETPAGAGPRR